MQRPTEIAEFHFRLAQSFAHDSLENNLKLLKGPGQAPPENLVHSYLAQAVGQLAEGLQHLSVGLRATYILLEQQARRP